MYAIIENGSKQYKVAVDDVVRFEKLDAEVGGKVEFKVLLVSDDKKGIMTGKKADAYTAVGEVLEHNKAKKVIVYKYKSKKNERRKHGHRQPYTTVKIVSIAVSEK